MLLTGLVVSGQGLLEDRDHDLAGGGMRDAKCVNVLQQGL